MGYIDPATVDNPTSAQPASAAWADAVRDAIDWIANSSPRASVYATAATSVSHNTLTKLPATHELSDLGGMHSTVSQTERLVVPTGAGGLYEASFIVEWDPDTTGERMGRFLVNNTTPHPVFAGAPNPAVGLGTVMNGETELLLAAGDYVETQVRQTSGSALDATLLMFRLKWVRNQ